MVRALLGLGSNLGDRIGHIQQAIALLAAHPDITPVDHSRLYETRPVAMADADADWFINAAILIDTTLSAQALLHACLDVERRLGRERPASAQAGYASRTMDIDILFYGNAVIREPHLTIPHPRLHERAFILAPLMDIAPDWPHPELGRTVSEMALARPDRDAIVPLTADSSPALI